jgi:signal transduction histidine kinase
MTALDPIIRRIRRAPPIAIDVAIAGAVFTLGFIDLHPTAASPLSPIGLLTLGTIGLTFRRKKIWIAFLLIQLAAVLGLILHVDFVLAHGGNLVELVVLYTVAESRDAAVSSIALLPVLAFDWIAWHQFRSSLDHPVSEWLFLLVVFQDYLWYGFAWYAGLAQNRRHLITAELEKTAVELRKERDRLAGAAVATERARIAQDLHALVVRGLEDMNRQTRSAQLRLGGDGTRALEAIVAIEARGRETLVQMRRLLSVLRAPSGASGELSRLIDWETSSTDPHAVPSSTASLRGDQ